MLSSFACARSSVVSLEYLHSHADAADEARTSQHAIVDRSGLERSADQEYASGQEDRPLAGDFVRDPSLVHGACGDD